MGRGVKDSGMEMIGQVRASVKAGSEERSRGPESPTKASALS